MFGKKYRPTLIEKEINDLTKRLYKLEKKGRFRRLFAYGLKIVAGGGSLIIALNVVPKYNHYIGIAALVAIFIDGVFANYERLVGEMQAGYAARAQRELISREYNRTLDRLLKKLKDKTLSQSDRNAVDREKDDLQENTQKRLADAVTSVEKALADLDLKALRSLSLDTERTAAQKDQSHG